MICPKDFKPCIDDLCHGGGCLQMDGYPMLDTCNLCGGMVDFEDPDCGSCTCDDGRIEHCETQPTAQKISPAVDTGS